MNFSLPLRATALISPQGRQVIDIAAGKRYTLFLCDDGLMFSVGEGLRWQLGTTSEYLYQAHPQAVQRLPKQASPYDNE